MTPIHVLRENGVREWTGKQPQTLTNMCMYRYLTLFFYHYITAVRTNEDYPIEGVWVRREWSFYSFCVVASVLCCPWTSKYPHWRCSGCMSHHSGLYHPFDLCSQSDSCVSSTWWCWIYVWKECSLRHPLLWACRTLAQRGSLLAFEVTFSPSVGLELWSTAGEKRFWTGSVLYCVLMTFKY